MLADPATFNLRPPGETPRLREPRDGDPVYPPAEAMLAWLREHDPGLEVRHFLRDDVECVSVRLHHQGREVTKSGPATARQKVVGQVVDLLRASLGIPAFHRATPEDDRKRAAAARARGQHDIADALDRRDLPRRIVAARAAGQHQEADGLELQLLEARGIALPQRLQRRR